MDYSGLLKTCVLDRTDGAERSADRAGKYDGSVPSFQLLLPVAVCWTEPGNKNLGWVPASVPRAATKKRNFRTNNECLPKAMTTIMIRNLRRKWITSRKSPTKMASVLFSRHDIVEPVCMSVQNFFPLSRATWKKKEECDRIYIKPRRNAWKIRRLLRLQASGFRDGLTEFACLESELGHVPGEGFRHGVWHAVPKGPIWPLGKINICMCVCGVCVFVWRVVYIKCPIITESYVFHDFLCERSHGHGHGQLIWMIKIRDDPASVTSIMRMAKLWKVQF